MLTLPGWVYDEMIAHLQAELPNEGCGLIAACDGEVTRHYPTRNAAASPVIYEVDSRQLLDAWREIEESGWQLFVIYHSHVNSPAFPSKTDVALAYYPDAYYVIVSFANPDKPIARAFHIIASEVSEEELEIG